jgi:uncharacterized membrane protein YkvA (DUF1232 family)
MSGRDELYRERRFFYLQTRVNVDHRSVIALNLLESLKDTTRELKNDVRALYLARGDPRIPWYAKIVLVVTVAYAMSPVDLIPDFIPVLGYLDDLIIIPAGIALAIRLIPENVLDEYREVAKAMAGEEKPRSRAGLLIVLLIWLLLLCLAVKFLFRILG